MMTPAEVRRQRNMSVEDLARAVGRSPGYIARCEREGAPLALARRLSAALGLPIDAFLPGRGTPRMERVPRRCRKRRGTA